MKRVVVDASGGMLKVRLRSQDVLKIDAVLPIKIREEVTKSLSQSATGTKFAIVCNECKVVAVISTSPQETKKAIVAALSELRGLVGSYKPFFPPDLAQRIAS